MIIIGCDFHPSTQTLAWKNTETGECGGHELRHDGEAQAFYRNLRGQVVRVGMEATGHARSGPVALPGVASIVRPIAADAGGAWVSVGESVFHVSQ